MGHEYLEMKNISGAIQAYRNAVDYGIKLKNKILEILEHGMGQVKHMSFKI